ncbi:MAG: GNAT family N-acetyltransferase [Oscillospiraceae bacterium]|jgi:RimJ/RimL family protein N-acetyltransferase|nr:GNAT family N-acetyltransferase [Oscillospiraceae bacterium]
MRFRLYTDVKEFYRDTYDVFMLHEAQNVIPLGNLIIGSQGQDKTGWRDPAHWFMATVEGSAGVCLAAIMTPPYRLTLYAANNEYDDAALRCLIDGIKECGVPVPGVMTEKGLAERFARLYANGGCNITCSQRIYELLRVNPEIPPAGTLRTARESDMAFLPYWREGFRSDCHGGPFTLPADAAQCRHDSLGRPMYVLEDGGTPVSMANITRELQTACCVGGVYTPPYFRGRGYATACVAAVSRLALGRGFTRCVLYTDLANPTSNSIYRKIGYAPIADSLDIGFGG